MTTLLEQIAIDADAITSDTENGLAEPVLYNPSVGIAKEFDLIMNRTNFSAEFQVEGENLSKTGTVYIARSNVDQPARGDQLTAADGIWSITAIAGQNVAGTTCMVMLKTRITNGHIHR